jgi:transposase
MINERTIFEIHRLHHEGQSVREIAGRLAISRDSVSRYLAEPTRKKPAVKRPSKLDSFKPEILRLLETDPKANSEVIRQRLLRFGFDGGNTILKDYLRTVRPSKRPKQAFIRFESAPGEQIQVDWGHFGSLPYGKTARKLYCMAMIECHSRMLYLEFTHSQRQEALHRALLNGFIFFKGTPGQIVTDNMLTAVLERDGPLIRFNENFLSFLRPFKIAPFACNLGQGHEKGKIEKGAIHYIRNNFWPLRSFKDLADVQTQANHWRDHIANVRIHNTTGEKPSLRFRPDAMTPLPEVLPDCRDSQAAKAHTDFSVRFDANTYTVPPWMVGKDVQVKADHHTVTIYFKEKVIAVHQRSWDRRERVESAHHREEAEKNRRNRYLTEDTAILVSLGEDVKVYVEHLASAHLPLKKNIQKLLTLKDEYGSRALIEAIQEATAHKAYGADYIQNILYQRMTPQRLHPPVRLKEEALNRIRLEEPSLADFDAFVIKRKKRDDRDR